jgi:hypothetical protein
MRVVGAFGFQPGWWPGRHWPWGRHDARPEVPRRRLTDNRGYVELVQGGEVVGDVRDPVCGYPGTEFLGTQALADSSLRDAPLRRSGIVGSEQSDSVNQLSSQLKLG